MKKNKIVKYATTTYTCLLAVMAFCLFVGILNLDMNPRQVNSLLGIILVWASVIGIAINLLTVIFIKSLRSIAVVLLIVCTFALAEGVFIIFGFHSHSQGDGEVAHG